MQLNLDLDSVRNLKIIKKNLLQKLSFHHLLLTRLIKPGPIATNALPSVFVFARCHLQTKRRRTVIIPDK